MDTRLYRFLRILWDMLLNTILFYVASILFPLFALITPLCRIKPSSKAMFQSYVRIMNIAYILTAILFSLVSVIAGYLAFLNFQFIEGFSQILYLILFIYIVYMLYAYNLYFDIWRTKRLSFRVLFSLLTTLFPKFLVCSIPCVVIAWLFREYLFLLWLFILPGCMIALILYITKPSIDGHITIKGKLL